MQKKLYVQPVVSIVNLKPEERLASCNIGIAWGLIKGNGKDNTGLTFNESTASFS